MSYRIVYDMKVIELPENLTVTFHQRNFVAVELGGYNNCYSTRTNKRTRSWSAMGIGEDYEIISKACLHAQSCEGGSNKLHGRWTKPETYIRAWRTPLATPIPLCDAERERFSLTAQAVFRPEEIGREGKYIYAHSQLVKAGFEMPETQDRYTNRPILTCRFDLFDADQCQAWLDWAPKEPTWKALDVSGPGEI